MGTGFYLIISAVAISLGAFAGVCARTKSFIFYLCMVVAACLALIVWALTDMPGHVDLRHVLVTVLSILPLPVSLAFFPGLMVRRGSLFWVTFAVGGMATVGSMVVVFYWALSLSCYVLGDCL